jgi:hypothetical protein
MLQSLFALAVEYKVDSLLNSEEVIIHIGPSMPTTVFVFVSARCPCSRSYSQHIKELQSRFPQFHFYGVISNQDEDLELSKTYFRDLNPSFPVVFDRDAKLANHLKATKTPHAFIFDSSANLIYNGGIGDRRDIKSAKKLFLESALKDLAAHRPIKEKQTRTLGCYIVRTK